MAKIRTIKPEFWDSPGIETLDFKWRLLYIAMWQLADDYGRGVCNPREILGFAFPNDLSVNLPEISGGFREISRVFRTIFYTVGNRKYFAIPSWDKHQRIDKRAKASKYPAPEEGTPIAEFTYSALPAETVPEVVADHPQNGNPPEVSGNFPNLPETSGNFRAGTGEQGNRGTVIRDLKVSCSPDEKSSVERDSSPDDDLTSLPFKATATAEPETVQTEKVRRSKVEYPNDFEEWYNVYPRRAAKRAALKAWRSATKRTPKAKLLDDTRTFAEACIANGTEESYIPYPATWLNRDGWLDEPATQPQARTRPAAQRVPAGGNGSNPEDWLIAAGFHQVPNEPDDYIDAEILAIQEA